MLTAPQPPMAPRRTPARAAVASWLLGAVIGCLLVLPARAEVAPAREAPNLATARVVEVATNAATPPYLSGSAGLVTADTLDPLDDYHPLTGALSDPPADDEARVRVLITGPCEPLVMDIWVYVDGRSISEARNAWVDSVVAAAATGVDAQAEGPSDPPPGFVAPRERMPPTLRSRLTNYLNAVGADAPRDEIRWLLEQWPTGPAITVLGPGKSWQRAHSAPLWDVLDTDGDGAISADERYATRARLATADVDQNGVIGPGELLRASERSAPSHAAPRGPLLVVVDPHTNWRGVRLPDGPVDGRRAEQLARQTADIVVRVDFGERGRLDVHSATHKYAAGASSTDTVVTLPGGAGYFELSAGQAPESNDGPVQIALGAVVDGRPLMRLVDADGDLRLTHREIDRLAELLGELDTDADGVVSTDETPHAVRIAIARGAVVHGMLADFSPAAAATQRERTRAAAPDWFRSMDANSDGDLSREEFAGDREQFSTLDADHDGLLSANEAAAASG